MRFVSWSNKSGPSGPQPEVALQRQSEPTPEAGSSRHDKPKRNRACQRCRKAKIRCEKADARDEVACKRCSIHNLECIVEVSIPGIQVVGGGSRGVDATHNLDSRGLAGTQEGQEHVFGIPSNSKNPETKKTSPDLPEITQKPDSPNVTGWENSVENRLQKFDTALDDILGLLKDQKRDANHHVQLQPPQPPQSHPQPNPTQLPFHPSMAYPALRPPLNAPLQSPGLPQPYQYFGVPPGPAFPSAIPPAEYLAPPTLPPIASRKREFGPQDAPDPKRPAVSNSGQNKTKETTELDRIDETTGLDQILSLQEAEELFKFFDSNITPQLFGFSIASYKVEELWKSSPLLVATVCCIASMHHQRLGHLSVKLNSLLHELTKQVLFSTPKDEVEGFNTIIALCICGFWFQKDQMFTGLALQMAKTMGLNSAPGKRNRRKTSDPKRCVSDQERLKLWYLLYILDGQQALVFNRQPMIDATDGTLGLGMSLLAGPTQALVKDGTEHESEDETRNNKAGTETPTETETKNRPEPTEMANYSNLRLVSQVEYNLAISDVFKGDAWDMMAPASFGIPFRTNLELDKWMVHWTVLLSPLHAGSIWSSKSTLIYYNFAKMHINSSAVRSLHTDGLQFPTLSKAEGFMDKRIEEVDSDGSGDENDEDFNEEDEDDDETTKDTFTKELSPGESRKASSQLAISAAQTVLNLVLGDEDILHALKYVPVHIHIMLYYAALLVLNPPEYLRSSLPAKSADLASFRLVKRLRAVIASNTPVDTGFASKLLEAFDSLLYERFALFKREFDTATSSGKSPAILKTVLDQIEVELQAESPSDGALRKDKPQRISAWPGSDHGHP
ncbi:unnamed protein product [Kuraishia capsulata CBS 1993]|uniref:Zn(2)-C6 fungal-type domain-containing protein n=1 Tax=Kuraishia capsulata CBS 1993 TaxID=1382522 RepID=W6MIY1_9ASCO|nr:uncharacterized protein KUCA_T00001879001 [Kuraishia capsulata CBS 1993]CDK25908.1 unnamed protein product [Kuraishia capsulata CBS 1993]